MTPGRAPRCGVLSVFNTRGPVDAKWMMRSLERRLRQDARDHQSGTRGRGFGGTEVAMLILIAHTGKTVELECDGTSR